MIQRIKQVLLTQYIGAIIVAFLAVQGIAVLITIPVQILANVAMSRQRGVLYRGIAYDWGNAAPPLVSAALHLLIAYLLLWWLFLRKPKTSGDKPTDVLDTPTSGGAGTV